MDHTQLHSQSELVAVAVVLSQLQIVYHWLWYGGVEVLVSSSSIGCCTLFTICQILILPTASCCWSINGWEDYYEYVQLHGWAEVNMDTWHYHYSTLFEFESFHSNVWENGSMVSY
jgi:hypothetical protein